MNDIMSESTLRSIVEGMKGTRATVRFLAKDDQVQMLVSLREYPPAQLWLGPEELLVDDKLALNSRQLEDFEDPDEFFIVEGGERVVALIEDVRYLPEGPGPAQFGFKLEVLEER